MPANVCSHRYLYGSFGASWKLHGKPGVGCLSCFG